MTAVAVDPVVEKLEQENHDLTHRLMYESEKALRARIEINEKKIAERQDELEAERDEVQSLLMKAESNYELELGGSITALAAYCDAREKLASSYRLVQALKARARRAGLPVKPTMTFCLLQAQDRNWHLRQLLARSQEALRGSW